MPFVSLPNPPFSRRDGEGEAGGDRQRESERERERERGRAYVARVHSGVHDVHPTLKRCLGAERESQVGESAFRGEYRRPRERERERERGVGEGWFSLSKENDLQ